LEAKSQATPAALGLRVKSGWAMAALVSGSASSPSLLRCQAVLLSDPAEPRSKQPYHAALDLPDKKAALLVRKLCKVVGDAAKRSVAELLRHATAANHVVRAAGLIVGSVVDPASLHNEHIRAHALEGQLFRAVLEEAFYAQGIACEVLVEKNAYATASTVLRKGPAEAKRMVASLGNSREGSWRAEEKLAALGGWFALASNASGAGW
jgi:hypothetical protein